MTYRALTSSVLLAGGLVLAGCLIGRAAEDRGSQSDQDACTADVFRLCSDFIPDEGPIVKCLQSKGPQLSPACHQVFFSTPTPTPAPAKMQVAEASRQATTRIVGRHRRLTHRKHDTR